MPTSPDEPSEWREVVSAINPLLELFVQVIAARGRMPTISLLAKFTGTHTKLVPLATYRLEVTTHGPRRHLMVVVTRNGWHKVTTQYSSVRTLLQNWKIV